MLPTATADAYATNEDTPLTVSAPGVLANDTDLDGDTLSAVLVSRPGARHAGCNADGTFTYTPAANFIGADSFTYTVSDGRRRLEPRDRDDRGRLDQRPAGRDADAYATNEDTRSPSARRGAGERHRRGRRSAERGPGEPARRTARSTCNADGAFTYTPAADFIGTGRLHLHGQRRPAAASTAATVYDDGRLDRTTLPTATADAYATNEDTPLTVIAPACWPTTPMSTAIR